MANLWGVDVDKNGNITTPGKFEGQRAYMPCMYGVWLEGNADEEKIGPVDCITVIVDDEDRRLWPELANRRTVKFTITDQGFVEEVGGGGRY